MQANTNPRVLELLSWHGHASGGVHVPFQARTNPIGRVVETPLIQRLRGLASDIAANAESLPRWIFLVGGPGNGKSETVQDFLICLDQELGLGGALSEFLSRRFSGPGLLPRKIEVLPSDLGQAGAQFAARVGRLIIIQDATATESALGNAANELAHDIADLLTYPDHLVPVFVACANRGLLARAVNEAFHAFGPEITNIITGVIQASSLGRETLLGRKSCWPLESDNRFACWPLDVESLLCSDTGSSVFDAMLVQAVDANKWEVDHCCKDCDARTLCPFRQNSEWLRNDETRLRLVRILRHGELARGQRWNFRDSFSLIAELLVGQWSDFDDSTHPCNWVHRQVSITRSGDNKVQSVIALALRLYGNALFRGGHVVQAAKSFVDGRTFDSAAHPVSRVLLETVSTLLDGETKKSIREMLANDYSGLDSASATPLEPTHPIRMMEDAFCQSIEQGKTVTNQTLPLAASESLLLDLFAKAETEWDLLGRDSATATVAVCLLKKLASMVTKRSIGVRLGYHALDDFCHENDPYEEHDFGSFEAEGRMGLSGPG